MKGTVHPKIGRRDKDGNLQLRPVSATELRRVRAKARKAVGELPDHATLGHGGAAALSAQHVEGFIRQELEHLELGGATPEELAACRRRLAVCLRTQGRMREAMDLVPNDAKFLAGYEALVRDGSEWCACEQDTYHSPEYGCKMFIPLYSRTTVYYPDEEGGNTTLWRCTKCQHLNITNNVPPQMEMYMRRLGSATQRRGGNAGTSERLLFGL